MNFSNIGLSSAVISVRGLRYEADFVYFQFNAW